MSIKFTVLSTDPVARYLSENATLVTGPKYILENKLVIKLYEINNIKKLYYEGINI
jgi:hypothetical protein